MIPRLAAAYDPPLVVASKSALLELARTLRSYSSSIVLVGGWVPYLLIEGRPRPGTSFAHVGSIDIDLVVDPSTIGADEYTTIVELIQAVGWRPHLGSLFSLERDVSYPDGRTRTIKVDFLTPAPEAGVGRHRHRPIQRDLRARTMEGAELAISHHSALGLRGTLPNGGEADAEIQMLDVVGCLGTKGIALGDRYKHKDAYDIVSVLENYGPDLATVADEVRQFAPEPLLARALGVMTRSFDSPEKVGAVCYADFRQPGSAEERERLLQRASQVVMEFVRLVGE